MKRDCDVKILEKQYEKGDLVYVLDTAQHQHIWRVTSTSVDTGTHSSRQLGVHPNFLGTINKTSYIIFIKSTLEN
jgi:hypothetical protein